MPDYEIYIPDYENVYNNEYVSRTLSENDNINNQQTRYQFYYCNILISKLSVTNCWALGSGVDPASGGAIYVYKSSLTTSGDENNFKSNRAATGGAICCVQSQVYLIKSIFNKNVAYKFGGAVCYDGDSNLVNTLNVRLVLQECNFIENRAHSCGGGLSVIACTEAILDHCEFKQNHAASFGGGMECCMTKRLDIFDTKFINNYITNHFLDEKEVEDENKKQYQKSIKFGGGALYFEGPPMPKNGEPPSVYASFYTQSCCFFNNFVLDKDNTDEYDFSQTEDATTYGGRGHEIYLNSYIGWNSMNDDFKNPEFSQNLPNQYIYYTQPDGKNLNWVIMQTNGTAPVCEESGKSINRATTDDISYATISNSFEGEQKISDLPSPSEYTYVATQFTRVPRETPYNKFPTAKPLEKDVFPFTFSSFSVIATNAITPHSTPFSTAFETPHSTPHSRAFSTAHSTPFSTAFETPHSTPHSTGHVTPFATVFSTAEKTAFETPFSTAHSTAHSTPFSTAHSTPFVTAFETPFSTAHSTAHSTPFDTVFSTAEKTAFETPFSTAHSTAFSTAHETPFSTAFKTAFETPFSTAFITAFKTPSSTAFVTAFETPSSTAFVTAF
ncbi:hypothetical protein TVAG_299190 [Trichomonas vaginalis G3]|uniref:Polymorphic outer membrane protein n=1 Tax=Trichomonas vaginalis (strain ATCC PRA-98 / G3) TaxID=412133 RepID=A2EVP6_TRIV3|nr:bifunctional inhibitor/lipid-transfer protein/seed storage 2s albumin superfamily protein family [Trichomonas vaginalis G3]EAY03256.1 hypothetical protein TVAG_299190 [Trichomonas vaginalis G3]KAI5535590.1 bifunctional inhibitor/lipid-transfer protein/seed storage 2s albumin superfamily protein family [Trichomonas vaginalis G3]|eukprot:XP_001315479.1 hypothetical protein [Trichomonas vaginalis G3]